MKILFITDKYYPKPYANAVCAQNLMNEYIAQGHSVDAIFYKDAGIDSPTTWNGVRTFSIVPDLRLQLFYYADNFNTPKARVARIMASILSKIKGIFLIPYRPFYSWSFPNRIAKLIKELHEKESYDLIVTMFHPFDGVYALYKLKNKGFSVPWVVYSVDRMVDMGESEKSFQKWIRPYFWEEKFLKYCDAFFYMKSRNEHYQSSCFEPYRDKLHAVDLPMLLTEGEAVKKTYDFGVDAEHWVYAGTLGGIHYDAEALLSFFMELPNDKKRILHFFGRGKEIDILQKRSEELNGKIVVHGYVDQKTLFAVQNTADVLVSLKTSAQISAKTFGYISTCKPIIHFSGHEQDPNVSYFDKYSKSIIIRTFRGNVEEWLASFYEQQNRWTSECEQEEIKCTFVQNTPEYNCVKILESIQR